MLHNVHLHCNGIVDRYIAYQHILKYILDNKTVLLYFNNIPF